MEKLNCIIVDDEPLAQDLIEKFIDRIPYLTLKAKYANAIEAIDGISHSKADIVFLDINMPEMSGIEFLNSLTVNRPHIIMTTAYPQYAVEGFEHDAVDYLLKPIAFSRFMRAINKVKERMVAKAEPEKEVASAPAPKPVVAEKEIASSGSQDKFFMIKVDKKLMRVNLNDIIFVEGMKDYVKVHLQNNFLITHITMTKISEMLPPNQFIRINRSFIVQINCIKCIEGNMVETSNGKKLAVGFNYREVIKVTAKSWSIQQ